MLTETMDGSLRSPNPWTARFARHPTDCADALETGEFDVIAVDWVSVATGVRFALNLAEICEN